MIIGMVQFGLVPRRARAALAFVLAAVALSACTASLPKASPSGGVSTLASTTEAPALPSSTGTYDPDSDPIVRVVERVTPAVVNVTTRTISQSDIFGNAGSGRAVGTGFIIRSDGVVVTNFHVIEQALTIKITLPPPDNRTFQAHWIGGDGPHDLAVLKVDGAGHLPTVPLGDSGNLKLGERVIALGYALALPGGPTVTSGIISSLARTVQAQDPNAPNGTRTYEDVLQTDAAINPGNSGGPLVDLDGNVVGINTAGSGTAENVGFSIAIHAARPFIDQALGHPAAPTAFLGVTTTTVGPGVASQAGLAVDHGALVAQVAPGGPAQQAGIRQGDVIVAFDETPVNSSEDLGRLILDRSPGAAVVVRVVRADGKVENVKATLGTRPVPVASP
jgi:S1-C subfamily serine protease